MALLDLLPKKETREALQGIEATLSKRRQTSAAGLVVAIAGAVIQSVALLSSNTSFIDTFNKLIHSLLSEPQSFLAMLLSREALGMLLLVVGSAIYFILRRTSLFMRDANEPFRYTFSIDKFKTVENAPSDGGFSLNDSGKLNLLHYDVRERLDSRIKRFSLLPTPVKDSASERYRSHIHISADLAIREHKDKWVIHVMPQIRIGPEGEPSMLATPTKYPLCDVKENPKGCALSAQQYDQLAERVYSSISTEIYRQLETDIREKIKSFPSDYMRAITLCVEAEDFSRSNTVAAYDRAIGIFEDALRYFAVADVKPLSKWLLRMPLLWRTEVRFQHRHARARIGYARCLIYRRLLSSYSGRARNPIFHARTQLEMAISTLDQLETWFTGARANGRLQSLLNFLAFPADSWSRALLLRPREALWETQRRLRFDAYTLNALCHQHLNAIKLARDCLALAQSIDPPLSRASSTYFLVAAEIEPDLSQKILLLRRSVEFTPEAQIPQYLLANYVDYRFRRSEELSETHAQTALDEYEKVLRINPGNIAAIAAQGYLYWLCSNLDKAEQKFNEGLELKSVVTETYVGEMYYGLARIAAERGRWTESLGYFSAAVEADPSVASYSPDTNSQSIALYFESIGSMIFDRYKTFAESVQRAVDSTEKQAAEKPEPTTSKNTTQGVLSYVLNDFGNACWNYFFRRGDKTFLQLALQSYRRAVQAYPANIVAYFDLWNTCEWLGEREEALKSLDVVVDHFSYWQPAIITHIWYTLQSLQGSEKVFAERDGKLKSEEEAQDALVKQKSLERLEAARVKQVKWSSSASEPLATLSGGDFLEVEQSKLDQIKKQRRENGVAWADVKRQLDERPVESLRRGLANTKLAPLLERADIDLNGKGIDSLLTKSIAWEKLGEEEAQAIRAWASALSMQQGSGRAWRSAFALCDLLEEQFFRDQFDLCDIQVNLIEAYKNQLKLDAEQAKSFSDGIRAAGLPLPSAKQMDDKLHQARASVREIVEYWIKGDPFHFGALIWVHNRFITGDAMTENHGKRLLDMPVTLAPHDPRSYEVLGNSYLWLARYDRLKLAGAESAWEGTVKLAPKNANYLAQLAYTYAESAAEAPTRELRSEKLTKSRDLYAEATQLDIDDHAVWAGLAKAHAELGEQSQSAAAWAHATQLAPENQDYRRGLMLAYNQIGLDHYRQSAYDHAAEWFRKAISVKPDDPVLYANLADALENWKAPGKRLAHFNEALNAVAKAIELVPGYSQGSYVTRRERLAAKRDLCSKIGEHALDQFPIVTPVAVELAKDLIPLAEGVKQDEIHPFLNEKITEMRSRILNEPGVQVPGVRFRGNESDLPAGNYIIMINEIPLVMGHVSLDHRLYPGPLSDLTAKGIEASPSINPLSGEPAAIIERAQWPASDIAGILTWNPTEQIIFHIESVLLRFLPEFFGHQEVANQLEKIDRLSQYNNHPTTSQNLTSLTQVCRLLLAENVPVTPFDAVEKIFQENTHSTGRLESIVASVRRNEKFRPRLPGNSLAYSHFTLSDNFERAIDTGIKNGAGDLLGLKPETCQELLAAIRIAIDGRARPAIVVSDDAIRPFVRQLIELEWPKVPVLARGELVEKIRLDGAAKILFGDH